LLIGNISAGYAKVTMQQDISTVTATLDLFPARPSHRDRVYLWSSV